MSMKIIKKRRIISKKYDINEIYKLRRSHIEWRLKEMDNFHKYPKIAAICPSIRVNENYENIIVNFIYQRYPITEKIVVTSLYVEPEVEELFLFHNIKIIKSERMNIGCGMNTAIENTNCDLITKMDDDNYYYDNFLYDLYLMKEYNKDYSIVGKRSTFILFDNSELYINVPDKINMPNDCVVGAALLYDREVWESSKYPEYDSSGEDTKFRLDAIENGFKVYASDPFNFINCRNSNSHNHTWDMTKNDFIKKGRCKYIGNDKSIVEC
ncbi:MAG: glycosyltransferase [Candidatus Lokiarchaeota archaeon]|nr:glycosyltransferase [Candidatus Lokiarchaeota archaeon]MBD3199583.1 glycosyltransferase [Candidatus Lokiarchaeota archaeon]